MIYRIAWIGLGVAVVAGVMYLGAVGITVAKRPVQVEVPIQYFMRSNQM
ncbi:MAG: hypothetical protein LBR89_04805 [Holosporales bacterium]|jgi:hypothetical protein|nr:hypothetical protein [Holosporales bacterium]